MLQSDAWSSHEGSQITTGFLQRKKTSGIPFRQQEECWWLACCTPPHREDTGRPDRRTAGTPGRVAYLCCVIVSVQCEDDLMTTGAGWRHGTINRGIATGEKKKWLHSSEPGRSACNGCHQRPFHCQTSIIAFNSDEFTMISSWMMIKANRNGFSEVFDARSGAAYYSRVVTVAAVPSGFLPHLTDQASRNNDTELRRKFAPCLFTLYMSGLPKAI